MRFPSTPISVRSFLQLMQRGTAGSCQLRRPNRSKPRCTSTLSLMISCWWNLNGSVYFVHSSQSIKKLMMTFDEGHFFLLVTTWDKWDWSLIMKKRSLEWYHLLEMLIFSFYMVHGGLFVFLISIRLLELLYNAVHECISTCNEILMTA